MSLIAGSGTPISGQTAVVGAAATQIATQAAIGATALGGHPSSTIIIQALAANTGKVYVGGPGVTTATGLELGQGAAITLDHTDLSQFYVVGATGDKVSYIAIGPA